VGVAERAERERRSASTEHGVRLAFDLTSRAELLLRMGRFDEGEALLDELAAGIAKGVEPYKGRARRTQLLRALHATLTGGFDRAATAAAAVPAGGSRNATDEYAAALRAYAGEA
jgi:hypothetical protein